VERVRRLKSLTEEFGLNLAGAGVMLRLVERIAELEQQVQGLTTELEALRTDSHKQ
jgi:hypothetical protein